MEIFRGKGWGRKGGKGGGGEECISRRSCASCLSYAESDKPAK